MWDTWMGKIEKAEARWEAEEGVDPVELVERETQTRIHGTGCPYVTGCGSMDDRVLCYKCMWMEWMVKWRRSTRGLILRLAIRETSRRPAVQIRGSPRRAAVRIKIEVGLHVIRSRISTASAIRQLVLDAHVQWRTSKKPAAGGSLRM